MDVYGGAADAIRSQFELVRCGAGRGPRADTAPAALVLGSCDTILLDVVEVHDVHLPIVCNSSRTWYLPDALVVGADTTTARAVAREEG